MVNLLINKAKVSELLQIAIGIPEADFEKYIEEAQKFDLKEILPEEFYYDLLKNKTESNYADLIDGGEYEYKEKNYAHDGIGAVLAYFTYARFQLNSPIVSTTYGLVMKNNPHSTPVELEERRSTYYKKREEANKIMKDVIKFIERRIDDYPLWNEKGNCTTGSKNNIKTRVIQ